MMNLSTIDYLGLDRVLRRGSGDIIAQRDEALFVRDRVSGAYMLACEDFDIGIKLLERYIGPDCDLLMVSDHDLGKAAFERFGFSEIMECYQAAYLGDKPSVDDELTVRAADENDLPMLLENYRMVSPEELGMIVRREGVLLGYYKNQLVGFIGEHLEGSMGILYVFPEYRQRGFGAALETRLIAETIEKGYIPFCQVEKENYISLRLQKKIGMMRSDNLIVWMWK